jgi:hypothetical protein
MATSLAQVPKQYYGYSLQCTECVNLLLDSAPGSVVSVEVFEDVGVTESNGTVKAVQTKAGSGANPISDSAVDLWKTFRNWIDQVKAGILVASHTEFEIFVNSRAKGNFCSAMSEAKSQPEIAAVILSIRKKFLDKKGTPKASLSEGLKKHLLVVLDPANEKHLAAIIGAFIYRNGSGRAYEELMARVAKTLVLDRVADVVLLYALGWTKRKIDQLIEQSKPANISVDEFRSELATYYNLFNTQAYLPSLSGMPSQDDINAHRSHLYVRQLEIIESSDDEMTTAVIDFLMAKANAVEYARRNLVNSTSFADFEATLQGTWKNRKKALELEANCKSDIHFGQRLANDCLGRTATLQGLVVPNNFTSGCFHALADELEIGWHPKYGTLLSGAAI